MSDKLFMEWAFETSEMSDDLHTKTGCVLIDSRGKTVGWGFNDFPSGVEDTPERRERPAKYHFTEHAERNAIYTAAKLGRKLDGCSAYVTWFPCVDCARALIGVGVRRLVCVEENMAHPKYQEEFVIARTMLNEAGVKIATVTK